MRADVDLLDVGEPDPALGLAVAADPAAQEVPGVAAGRTGHGNARNDQRAQYGTESSFVDARLTVHCDASRGR